MTRSPRARSIRTSGIRLRASGTSRALAVTVAAALLLSGCAAGGDPTPETETAAPVIDTRPLAELDLYDDPRTATGASTALIGDTRITPLVENPTQTLPATVTSHDPNGPIEVEVTDTSRVLALDMAGSLAATVWGLGLGDTLVGRDMTTAFPGTEELPVVTSGAHSINAEGVLALRPTLVITDGTIGPRDVLQQLREAGVTVVFVKNEPSFEGAAQLARDVAAVLGAPEAGEQLATQITADVDATIAEIAAIAPTASDDKLRVVFLYIRGTSGVYYLFGEESGADRLITALGARDVASELGWEGMRPVTDEAIVEADPDLILVMTHGLESSGGVDGLLAAKPALALTSAGQNSRIVDMDDSVVLSFGPRSASVLDALARAIYAKK